MQYFLSPLLLAKGFVAVLFSNMLYLVALSYYHYLNFLGYDGMVSLSSFKSLVVGDFLFAQNSLMVCFCGGGCSTSFFGKNDIFPISSRGAGSSFSTV